MRHFDLEWVCVLCIVCTGVSGLGLWSLEWVLTPELLNPDLSFPSRIRHPFTPSLQSFTSHTWPRH